MANGEGGQWEGGERGGGEWEGGDREGGESGHTPKSGEFYFIANWPHQRISELL